MAIPQFYEDKKIERVKKAKEILKTFKGYTFEEIKMTLFEARDLASKDSIY